MKKILVIDDDRGIVRLLQASLEKNGFSVSVAYNGQEGLSALPAVNPDLIVLDVEMPEMNGYQFMMRIKDIPEFQSIPVIVLTSHADKQDIFQIRKVKSYLIKPLDINKLLNKISLYLDPKPEPFRTKVLVIENNPTQTKLMQHFVPLAGYVNLAFAANGREGIEKAKTGAFDVIVIRDQLPDMPGYGIADELNRLAGLSAKKIYLCDAEKDADKTKLDSHRFSGYALKSAEYDFLIEALKNLEPTRSSASGAISKEP